MGCVSRILGFAGVLVVAGLVLQALGLKGPPPPIAPASRPSLAVGTRVRVADRGHIVVMTATRDLMERFLAGEPMRPGPDKFGPNLGNHARVIGGEGRLLEVELTSGNWKGREGWIRAEDVELEP
jgi:hypothetical protein